MPEPLWEMDDIMTVLSHDRAFRRWRYNFVQRKAIHVSIVVLNG